MDFERHARRTAHRPCAHGGRKETDSGAFLDASANVNPLAPCPELMTVLRGALDDPGTLLAYPDSSYGAARAAIARHAGAPAPACALPVNGAIELIALFCAAFVRPGDTGIVTAPTFCEYERFLCQHGGSPLRVPHEAVATEGPANALLPHVTPTTTVVFLCNPNNPTGDLASRREVCALARELEDRSIMVLVDEAFIDLHPEASVAHDVGRHPNVVVCRSLTKILGIPGLRAGYGIGAPDAVSLMASHQMPWSVNSLSRSVLESLSLFEPFMHTSARFLAQEKDWLFEHCSAVPHLTVHPSHAWYLMASHDTLSSVELVDRMRDRGVLVRGCHSFAGGDTHGIRLAVRGRHDNETLLAALRAVC